MVAVLNYRQTPLSYMPTLMLLAEFFRFYGQILPFRPQFRLFCFSAICFGQKFNVLQLRQPIVMSALSNMLTTHLSMRRVSVLISWLRL